MIAYLEPRLLALIIFIITYFFIATGWREKTIAAIVGATAMWAFGILKGEEAWGYVDLSVIGLIFGMMVIVGVLREAGFFRWVGIYLANLSKCRPRQMFILFTGITALLSAFLDNITTILFMILVTIEILEMVKANPKPFIIAEILAANIGGTATLVGDPPNIMIAKAADLTFLDFIINAAPFVLLNLLIIILLLFRYYRDSLKNEVEFYELPLKPSEVISDNRLFFIGVPIFFFLIFLFFIHDRLMVEPVTIAVLGAVGLLFLGGYKMSSVLEKVEWRTLLFFGSLFIVVGGIEKTGTIKDLAGILSSLAANDLTLISTILWLSSIGSSIIDNIPITAALIPMMGDFIGKMATSNNNILWWSLALGAGFGGNGTLIGSSATIVAVGIAESRGYRISFKEFFKIGMSVLLITTGITNILLLLRYLYWG